MSQITYTFFCFCAVFPKLRKFRVKSQSIYMFFALFFKLFFLLIPRSHSSQSPQRPTTRGKEIFCLYRNISFLPVCCRDVRACSYHRWWSLPPYCLTRSLVFSSSSEAWDVLLLFGESGPLLAEFDWFRRM